MSHCWCITGIRSGISSRRSRSFKSPIFNKGQMHSGLHSNPTLNQLVLSCILMASLSTWCSIFWTGTTWMHWCLSYQRSSVSAISHNTDLEQDKNHFICSFDNNSFFNLYLWHDCICYFTATFGFQLSQRPYLLFALLHNGEIFLMRPLRFLFYLSCVFFPLLLSVFITFM